MTEFSKQQLEAFFQVAISLIGERSQSAAIDIEKRLHEDVQRPMLLVEDAAEPLCIPHAIEEQVIVELRADPRSNKVKLEGLFQEAEKYNQNDRRYPLQLLEREVRRIQPLIGERRLIGELDHPDTPKIRLTDQNGTGVGSHIVTELNIDGTNVYGSLEPLTTKNGMELRSYIHDGVKLGVSSRGTGSLTTESNGKFLVNDDYRMLTFDVVTDPSVRSAFPKQQNESITEGLASDADKIRQMTIVLEEVAKKFNIQEIRDFVNQMRRSG